MITGDSNIAPTAAAAVAFEMLLEELHALDNDSGSDVGIECESDGSGAFSIITDLTNTTKAPPNAPPPPADATLYGRRHQLSYGAYDSYDAAASAAAAAAGAAVFNQAVDDSERILLQFLPAYADVAAAADTDTDTATDDEMHALHHRAASDPAAAAAASTTPSYMDMAVQDMLNTFTQQTATEITSSSGTSGTRRRTARTARTRASTSTSAAAVNSGKAGALKKEATDLPLLKADDGTWSLTFYSVGILWHPF